jgi:hypothetical protein
MQIMRNKTLVKDRLDGSSNFSSWKSRFQITLQEDDLLSVIQKDLPESATDEEKERQLASIVDVDPKPHQRNEDIQDETFLFASTLSSMVPTGNDIWLIDSGSSRHMTGYRDHLTDLVEKETSLHVVLGNNARYNVKGVGTSTFQLDSDIPFS